MTSFIRNAAAVIALASALTAAASPAFAQKAAQSESRLEARAEWRSQLSRFALPARPVHPSPAPSPGANTSRVAQEGSGNAAGILQQGQSNTGTILQYGRNQSATLQQQGSGNTGCIVQLGRDQSYAMTQSGDNLSVGVVQAMGRTEEFPPELCALQDTRASDYRRILAQSRVRALRAGLR